MTVLVQTVSASVSATTSSAIAMAATNDKSLILVTFCNTANSVNPITGITDTQSNSYARALTGVETSNGATVDIWYAYNTAGGANTVTVNFTSSTAALIIREYTDFGTVDPLDKTAGALGSSSPDSSGSTATTTQGFELVVGVIGTRAATWSSYTAGTGYGHLSTKGTGVPALGVEDKLVDTATTQAATFVVASSSAAVFTAVVTFMIPSHGLRPNNLRPHLFSPGLAR